MLLLILIKSLADGVDNKRDQNAKSNMGQTKTFMEVLAAGQIQAKTYTEIHDTDQAYCLYHHRGVLCIHFAKVQKQWNGDQHHKKFRNCMINMAITQDQLQHTVICQHEDTDIQGKQSQIKHLTADDVLLV